MTRVAGGGRRGAGRWGATAIGGIGIALWATETALASATGGLPPFEITGLAFGVAALLAPLAWWISGDDPRLAFRQPWWVWVATVPSLVAYHACIYLALGRVPAVPAALLQGCTPLFLMVGTALTGGQRLRWWHVAGAVAGLEGLVALCLDGQDGAAVAAGAAPYLLAIGLAAGLWGLYSLGASRFAAVPTSAMGVFYAASAAAALACHAGLERWVAPTPHQWAAIAGLGLLPMGLALFCWDFGLKQGDVQALGVASYLEPLIGAALVVAIGQGDLRWSMLVSGLVIIGGAVLGAASAFEAAEPLPRRLAWLPGPLQARLAAAARRDGLSAEAFVERCLERALGVGHPPPDPLQAGARMSATLPFPGESRAGSSGAVRTSLSISAITRVSVPGSRVQA